MEVGTAVRTAFYTKISGLTYNGLPVRVIDEYETAAQDSPYVVLSTQTEQQMDNDDQFIWDTTIMIKVIAFGDLIVGKKAAEDLGWLIQQNVQSLRGEQINTVSGYDITGVKLLSTNTMPFPTTDRVYINKLYRYGQQVQQTT